MAGLYVHIPFCRRKCGYCDFYSEPGKEAVVAEYISAIDREFERHKSVSVETIYVGGGTPSVLRECYIQALYSGIKNSFNFSEEPESTFEINPESITEQKLSALVECGVNRLSIGAQSFIDEELGFLGRVHNSASTLSAVQKIKSAGFSNFSLDLIYGLPSQTLESWRYSINTAISLCPAHISAYPLTIEEHTQFHNMNVSVNNDIQADFYEYLCAALLRAGFKQYEISNWALPGRECKHNLKYWNNEEYIGAGAGACSYINSVRKKNVQSIEEYIRLVSMNADTARECDILTGTQKESESIILGLRKLDGIDITQTQQELFGNVIDKLAVDGLIMKTGARIALTKNGLLLANRAFMEFIQ